MSYCRFSCMNFNCDLYVYESEGGVCVDIAETRLVSDAPKPTRPNEYWSDVCAHKRHRAAMEEWEKTARREPIAMPFAGTHHNSLSHVEAVELLKSLRGLGYVFPDHVIPALIEAIGEEVAAMKEFLRSEEGVKFEPAGLMG